MSDAASGPGPARHASAGAFPRAIRLERWLPRVAGVVVLAIALATMHAVPVGVFWDDGVYLISAKALATGAGYRMVHLPGAPAAVHYPPAWPALLSVFWRLLPDFPASVPWLKLLNPLLLGAAAWAASVFGVRRLALSPWVAAAVVITCTAALPLLVVAGVLFSEPFFLLTLFLALLAADQAAERGGWRWAIVAGLVAGGLMLVRTAGVAIIPALLGALLLSARSRRRDAVVAAGALAATVVPWQLWLSSRAPTLPGSLRGSYGPYLDWVLDLYRERGAGYALLIARENILGLFRTAGIALFPFGFRALRPLMLVLLLVLATYGLLASWRRSRAAVLFVVGYLGVVLVWPYAPDRFLWAVWPLLGLMTAAGATAAWRLRRDPQAHANVRVTSIVVAGVAALTLADHAAYSIRGVSRGYSPGGERFGLFSPTIRGGALGGGSGARSDGRRHRGRRGCALGACSRR